MMRPFKSLAFFAPFAVLVGLFRFVYFGIGNKGYEADKLTYLTRKIGGKTGLPLSSLNQRTSAHYIEINSIYGAEMMKRYHKIHTEIIHERNHQTEYVKKMKYADPSYEYVQMKPVTMQPDEQMV